MCALGSRQTANTKVANVNQTNSAMGSGIFDGSNQRRGAESNLFFHVQNFEINAVVGGIQCVKSLPVQKGLKTESWNKSKRNSSRSKWFCFGSNVYQVQVTDPGILIGTLCWFVILDTCFRGNWWVNQSASRTFAWSFFCSFCFACICDNLKTNRKWKLLHAKRPHLSVTEEHCLKACSSAGLSAG